MEALARVNSNTVIKQTNSIVHKHSDNKVCKNRKEMSFKELIKHISKKLMGYAMTLSNNDPDDALDLIQSTMVKLIKNQDKLMDSDQPMAYANNDPQTMGKDIASYQTLAAYARGLDIRV